LLQVKLAFWHGGLFAYVIWRVGDDGLFRRPARFSVGLFFPNTNVEKRGLLIKVAIGKRIRFLRGNYKMSMEDLAKQLDITPGYLGLIERGKRGTSESRLIDISHIFRVSLDYLMTGREKAPSKAPINAVTFIRDSLSEHEQLCLVELAKDLSTGQYTERELDIVFNGLHTLLSVYKEAKRNAAKSGGINRQR